MEQGIVVVTNPQRLGFKSEIVLSPDGKILHGEPINPAEKCKTKKEKHDGRKKTQRNRRLRTQFLAKQELHNVGSLLWVKTMTGLAPYNGGKGTEYLIGRGTTCIAEKMLTGYRLWLTGGRPYTSMKAVKANCKSYVARHTEVTYLHKPVVFNEL